MNGQTSEQAWIQIQFQMNLVQDPCEKAKLKNLILGAVESRELKKARINAHLDKYERYHIKKAKIVKK